MLCSPSNDCQHTVNDPRTNEQRTQRPPTHRCTTHKRQTRRAHSRGKGIGAAIVREVLQQAVGDEVYLVTISRRRGFYERLGFQQVPFGEIPG
jgi:GNAT superfamily N-acetyltransferase